MKVRLNKYLAECGIASRRGADEIIKSGIVKINGKVAAAMGLEVDTANDTVTVDGTVVKPISAYTYVMLNKPKGCVTTASDQDRDRKTVYDYLDYPVRLFSIGRLDYDSEGLLLFTNDGDLAQKLTHPSREIPKTYVVKVEGDVPENDLALLRKGVELDGRKTKRAKIKLIGKEQDGKISRFEMVIYEGRNRQIRRMFESVGKNVVFLKRTAVGDLRLGGLGRGKSRYLKDYEINYLMQL